MSKIEYLGGRRIFIGIVPEGEDYENYVEPPLERVPRLTRPCGSLYRPLVEVFSVQIMNINKVCNIYGTIRLREGIEIQHLYNRIREESESIGPEDDVYDQPTSDEVDGDYGDDYDSGSVIVNYIVFTHAVEATVTVTLLVEHGGEDPSHVYGRITACNSTFSEGSLLFRKKSNEHIDVMPGQLIPLSRSVVAVPFNSVLIVQADLWDYGAISSDVIAKGTAEFHTVFSGTFENSICCQDYKILVKCVGNEVKAVSNDIDVECGGNEVEAASDGIDVECDGNKVEAVDDDFYYKSQETEFSPACEAPITGIMQGRHRVGGARFGVRSRLGGFGMGRWWMGAVVPLGLLAPELQPAPLMADPLRRFPLSLSLSLSLDSSVFVPSRIQLRCLGALFYPLSSTPESNSPE
ncbi:hypothetical protein HHK36_018755 [Tetracentron sinense]|uniref:DUF6598 domain-containing protein n=1 Tax=Tetracentron sinense TaxID=13715 RepID=A0A835DC61_TETSI|nr:hypothetical protein HHK36_018755 [Tetracentron sinense]